MDVCILQFLELEEIIKLYEIDPTIIHALYLVETVQFSFIRNVGFFKKYYDYFKNAKRLESYTYCKDPIQVEKWCNEKKIEAPFVNTYTHEFIDADKPPVNIDFLWSPEITANLEKCLKNVRSIYNVYTNEYNVEKLTQIIENTNLRFINYGTILPKLLHKYQTIKIREKGLFDLLLEYDSLPVLSYVEICIPTTYNPNFRVSLFNRCFGDEILFLQEPYELLYINQLTDEALYRLDTLVLNIRQKKYFSLSDLSIEDRVVSRIKHVSIITGNSSPFFNLNLNLLFPNLETLSVEIPDFKYFSVKCPSIKNLRIFYRSVINTYPFDRTTLRISDLNLQKNFPNVESLEISYPKVYVGNGKKNLSVKKYIFHGRMLTPQFEKAIRRKFPLSTIKTIETVE